jgi:hypothetical protein
MDKQLSEGARRSVLSRKGFANDAPTMPERNRIAASPFRAASEAVNADDSGMR